MLFFVLEDVICWHVFIVKATSDEEHIKYLRYITIFSTLVLNIELLPKQETCVAPPPIGGP